MMRNKQYLINLSIFFAGAFPSIIDAKENQLSWGFSNEYSHNNNKNLSTQRAYISSTYFKPNFAYLRRSEVSSFQFGMFGNIERHSDTSYNRENGSGNFRYSQAFENGTLNFSYSFSEQSTREISFEETGVFTNEPVITESLAASGTLYHSERSAISVNVSFKERDYQSTRFSDYTYLNSGLSWSYALSEHLSTKLNISYNEYVSDFVLIDDRLAPPIVFQTENFSDSIAAQIGITGRLGEKINYSVLTGGTYTEQEQFNKSFLLNSAASSISDSSLSSDNNSNLTSSNIEYSGELSRISFSISHNQQPTGNGLLIESTSTSLSFAYRISGYEEFSASLAANRQAQSNKEIEGRFDLEREFAFVSLSYSKRLSENWKLTSLVRYRAQRYKIRPDDIAKGIRGSLSLQFSPKSLRWK